MQQCVKTYEKATGKKVVAPKDVKTGTDGKRSEIRASVEDACGDILFFKTIAEKAGKTLDKMTRTKAVNTMGTVDNTFVLGSGRRCTPASTTPTTRSVSWHSTRVPGPRETGRR